MKNKTEPKTETKSLWQQELMDSYTNLSQLAVDGLVHLEDTALATVADQYRIRIPRYYARLINPALGLNCPIFRQSIPDALEGDPILPDWATTWSMKAYQREVPWHSDAIGDIANLTAPRITHRYKNRALLHTTSLCGLYCRFCFRKTHLNDSEKKLYDKPLDSAYEYLRSHPEIEEIILTGGDPLSQSDAFLERIFETLSKIDSIKMIRIHSRMVVTLPSRITESLIEVMKSTSKKVTLVSHFNHPTEITPFALEKLGLLRKAGITLLNQSVLLKGVNDQVETLTTLFQNLYNAGCIPYYLHHPDWTSGTFHFRNTIEFGLSLYQELQGRVTGPALPKYILDIPHGLGKIAIDSRRIKKIEEAPMDSKLKGALYEVLTPETKETGSSNQKILYVDLATH